MGKRGPKKGASNAGRTRIENEWRNSKGHLVFWETLDNMLAIQCTQEEIAAVFQCCIDTLTDACKRVHGKTFSEYSSEKRGLGRTSLRRLQWKNAEAGNVTMQIWLGKQMLGQTDKTENKHLHEMPDEELLSLARKTLLEDE